MLVGQKIGPFVVDKELGSGAMGSVYRGKNAETGKKVAIKVIAMGLANNTAALARFKRETAILKQLDHPHIVKLLASGKVHGTPFYVMEYVEGESLDHVMDRRNRITWEELITLGQQLCAALQHAHEKGIIHRDLKPSNLMVLKNGSIKLTDFGIAKDIDVTALTAANSTVGTASYMSPEQCRGSREITNKSDLYSMGVMFFELITGRKPFLAETVMGMFMEHTKGTFPRPSRLVLDIPVWLDNIICQLLEKEPDKRPYSAEAVSQSLGMVKEKWESQQSAAMTAAKKRRADKSATDIALDDTDKEVARTMLGKKKKSKKDPFYRQNWFTGASVGGLALALLVAAWFIFFKAPGAESLYAEGEKVMRKTDVRERNANKEPFERFLQLYGDHPKFGQMQKWLDQIEGDMCELQMYNRLEKFKAEGDIEPIARSALVEEKGGRLPEATKIWQGLLKHKESKDPEIRPWGLVAAKHLGEIEDVDKLYGSLTNKYQRELQGLEKAVAVSPAEEKGLDAIKFEAQKQWKRAEQRWDDLKDYSANQDDRRLWFLLAVKRLHELPALQTKNEKSKEG